MSAAPNLDIDAVVRALQRAHARAVWGPIFTRLELLCLLAVLAAAAVLVPYALQRGPHAEATAPTAFTLAHCTGPALNETTYITVRNNAGRLQFNCTTVSILGR